MMRICTNLAIIAFGRCRILFCISAIFIFTLGVILSRANADGCMQFDPGVPQDAETAWTKLVYGVYSSEGQFIDLPEYICKRNVPGETKSLLFKFNKGWVHYFDTNTDTSLLESRVMSGYAKSDGILKFGPACQYYELNYFKSLLYLKIKSGQVFVYKCELLGGDVGKL